MDLENINAETQIDKIKLVNKVTLFLQSSRGGWCWDRTPEVDDDIESNIDWVEGMSELKIRENETMNDPVRLLTDTHAVVTAAKYNKNGRVAIRQIDPIPLTILSIGISGTLPR